MDMMGEQFGKCDRCQQVMYAGHECSAMTTHTGETPDVSDSKHLKMSSSGNILRLVVDYGFARYDMAIETKEHYVEAHDRAERKLVDIERALSERDRSLRECVELLEMVCSCYSVERHNSGGSGPTERTVCEMCLRKDALLARIKETL